MDKKSERIIEQAQYDHVYAVEQLKKALKEIARLRQHFDEQWLECHDGSETACCKAHE